MNKKYQYNDDFYEGLCNHKKFQLYALFLFPIGIFIIIKGLIALNMLDENFLGSEFNFGTLLIIICIILIITAILNYKRLFIICNNLPKCYLEINEDCISGFAFNKIHENDNGNYFELRFEEIRNVNINYTNSSFLSLYDSNNFYNFIINSSSGTYKLCIENVGDAKKQIENIISGKTEKQQESKNTNIPKKELDLTKDYILPVRISKYGTGKTSCPICGTEQPDDRFCCFNCGTPFMNNQKDVPYWCLDCGLPGPFEDKCPKCNSDKKLLND